MLFNQSAIFPKKHRILDYPESVWQRLVRLCHVQAGQSLLGIHVWKEVTFSHVAYHTTLEPVIRPFNYDLDITV